jgi:hypothetical protein
MKPNAARRLAYTELLLCCLMLAVFNQTGVPRGHTAFCNSAGALIP